MMGLTDQIDSFPLKTQMQLHISNHLEPLAEKLADSVHSLQKQDWSASLTILTPNFNLDKWISLTLAKQNQIAINLQFMPIEKFLQQQTDDPQTPIWTLEKLQLALIFELEQILELEQVQSSDPSVFQPLQNYFSSVPNIPELQSAKASRVTTLALHLAKVFQGYSIFRDTDILQKWEKGESFLTDLKESASRFQQDTEQWQSKLWEGLLQHGISLPRHLSQSQYNKPEGHVFVFGFSYLPPFQYQALKKLADTGCQIQFYALSPCQEFWQDLPTGRKVPQFSVNQQEESLLNSFLQYWGRPAQEHLNQLLKQTDYDFTDCFQSEESKKTFLSHIQKQLFHLQEKPYQGDLEHDQSLNFWAASSIQHEAEAVVGEICHRLATDQTLRIDQIAIITPNLADYQRTLEDTFAKIGKEALTYNLIDAVSEQACQLVKGVLLLLDLANSPKTRKTVWRLVSHSHFMARFQISQTLLKQWEGWLINAGIFDDSADDNIAPFGWEHAFRRMELGACFEEFSANQDFVIGDNNYPPLAMMDSHVPEVLQMVSILRELFEKLATLQQRKKITDWADFFAKLVERFLAPLNPPNQYEENMFLLVVQKLRSLEDLEDIGQGRELDGVYALQMARLRIQKITTEKGYYLAGGVSISSFQPMRPIPFRIIFMMGLSEDAYPRQQEVNQLDLASLLPPQSCDFTNREKDSYAFLETLTCARDAVYASYVNQNNKGEEALPSPLLQSMVRILNESYLQPNNQMSIKELPDYTSQDTPEFAKYSQEWIELTNIWQTRQALKEELKNQGTNIEQIPLDQLQQWKEQQWKDQLKQPQPSEDSQKLSPSDNGAEDSQNPTKRHSPSVMSYTLKNFLDNPAQATFQFYTRKTANDAIYHEIPIWNVEADLKYETLANLWHLIIENPATCLQTHIKDYQKYLKDRSLWNDHLLGTLSFQWIQNTLEHWQKVIEGKAGKKQSHAIYKDWKDFANDVCFWQIGDSPPNMGKGTKSKVLPPLIIQQVQVGDDKIDVEIKGDIGWVSPNAIFSFQASKTNMFTSIKECLLPAVLIAACESQDCHDFKNTLQNAYVIGEETKPRRTTFNMPSTDDARQFLQSMLENLLNQNDIQYYPLSAVDKFRAKSLKDWWGTFQEKGKAEADKEAFHQKVLTELDKTPDNPNTDFISNLEKQAVHEFFPQPENTYQALDNRLSFLMTLLT